MSFFRLARANEVKRIETPDGGDWIELKTEFSKAEINKVVLAAPKDQQDVKGGLSFIERFFEIAVTDWSLVDEDGNRLKPTIKNYEALHAEPAKWIDEQLAAHLQTVIGKEVEDAEGKDSN